MKGPIANYLTEWKVKKISEDFPILFLQKTKFPQNFCKFSGFSLEFKKVFLNHQNHFFLTVVQNNFGNKLSYFLS